MSNPTRTVATEHTCPKCSEQQIHELQRGVMVDQEPEPVRWVTVRRFCPGGCTLLAGDVPED